AGGTSPSRNASALTIASSDAVSATAECASVSAKVRNSASVNAADAKASSRIRLRATLGWSCPARQSRTDATTERIVQWVRNPAAHAKNPAERGSPAAGIRGRANVQTIIATVIKPSD